MAFLGTHNGVAVLHWPRSDDCVALLAQTALPRLLLVDPGAGAPPPRTPLQDWLPPLSAPALLGARVRALSGRAATLRSEGEQPALHPAGRLVAGAGWVAVPPVLRPLACSLVAHFDEPVGTAHLAAAAGCDRARLWATTARLTTYVNALGLDISTRRSACTLRWCAAARPGGAADCAVA